MHQATIVMGKSARVDVVVGVGVALATAVPAGSVGVNIGNATTMPWGIIERELNECARILENESKQAGGLTKAQQPTVGNGRPSITVSANNALTAETGIALVRNSAGGQNGQTEFVREGLRRCIQELRQRAMQGALAGVIA